MKLRHFAITALLGLLVSASASAQWFDQKIIRDAGECAATGNCAGQYVNKSDAEYQARMVWEAGNGRDTREADAKAEEQQRKSRADAEAEQRRNDFLARKPVAAAPQKLKADPAVQEVAKDPAKPDGEHKATHRHKSAVAPVKVVIPVGQNVLF